MPSPRVGPALASLLVAGAVAACGGSGSTTAGTGPVTLDDAAGGGGPGAPVGDGQSARLTAVLSGGDEVPDTGDPDGSGRATVVVEPGRSQLCYRIEVEGIPDADGTSVHVGRPGEDGAVVLGLDPTEGGSAEGCVTADPGLLDRLTRRPDAFYLNVRTDEHPDGALRGQLAKQ
jgi:hypothetical protein